MQNFVIFHYSLPVGTEHHPMALFTVCLSGSSTNVQLPLLSVCRVQAPTYSSLYSLSVGFKHQRTTPFTVSFSGSNTTLCLSLLSTCGVKTPPYVSHYSLSRVQTLLYVSHHCLCVRFQHHCTSPITVSL